MKPSSKSKNAGTLEKTPGITILIINWNGWRDTVECLKSLDNLTYRNCSVILIDNGSKDESVDRLVEWARGRFCQNLGLAKQCGLERTDKAAEWQVLFEVPRFTFIAVRENLGFSEGSNIGIEYALSGATQPDFVFFLNNDAVPEPDCLGICVEVSLKEDAAIVGALVKRRDGAKILHTGTRFPREIFFGTPVRLPLRQEEYWPVDSPQGCGMLIRRDLLVQRKEETGCYLDPKIFMYGEEVDFSIYAARKGYKVLLAKNAVIYHGVAQSSGGRVSPIVYYYSTRNRIYLAQKLLPWWPRVLFHAWYIPSRFLRAFQRLVQGNPSACAALLAGFLDGYRGVGGRWRRHPR